MKTKYDIGQIVNIPMEVQTVHIYEDKTKYCLKTIETKHKAFDEIVIEEEDLHDIDAIPIEDYEEEVNKLKDEIERLKSEIDRYKELYQFEHEQVAKVKDLLETMKSHLPERNVYGG